MLTYLLDYFKTLTEYFYDWKVDVLNESWQYNINKVNKKLQEIKKLSQDKYEWIEDELFEKFYKKIENTQKDIKKINPEHEIASKDDLKEIFKSYYAIWSPQG